MHVTSKDKSLSGLKEISCKDTKDALAEIRATLQAGEPFRVVNQYETFYGVSFDRWLREGIKDIPCDIKVLNYNHFPDCGYPWEYEITPKSNNQ